jgi:hypothetical protein
MISVRLRQGGKGGLVCQTLEGGCGIDQASVEEDPAGFGAVCGAVSESERDGSASEGDRIDPRQGGSVAEQSLVDDTAAGFFHCHVAAAREFGEQR